MLPLEFEASFTGVLGEQKGDLGLSFSAMFHYQTMHKRMYEENPFSIGFEFPDTDIGKAEAEAKLMELNGRFLTSTHGALPDHELSIGKVEENLHFLKWTGEPENYDPFSPPDDDSLVSEPHTHVRAEQESEGTIRE